MTKNEFISRNGKISFFISSPNDYYRGHEERAVVSRRKRAAEATVREKLAGAAQGDLADLITELTAQMHAAAEDLHFELAARLRDEIRDLKKELRSMRAAG